MRFLDTVIERLVQQGWEQLKNYTLVFPMQRGALFAKRAFMDKMRQEKMQQPVVLPRMVTIDELVMSWCDWRVEDEIRAIVRLYALYKQVTPDEKKLSLDTFYCWGQQILNDFNAIDMACLDVHKVITHTSQAIQMDELNLDEETKNFLQSLLDIQGEDDSIRRYFHRVWEVLPELYDRYKTQQQQEHIGSKGACYRRVIDHPEEWQQEAAGRTFVFVGFNYLLPAERQLMALLKDTNNALFFWDNDASFALDPHVYQYISANIAQFGQDLPSYPSEGQKIVTAIATTSASAQAQYVTQWLQENHKTGDRTAVVIADETMLESVLYALPEEVSGKVNITKGYPLRNTQVYAQVVAYLKDKQNDCRPGETYADVLRRLEQVLAAQMPVLEPDVKERVWQQVLLAEACCQTLLVIRRFITLLDEGVLTDIYELRTLRNLVHRSLEIVTLPFHGEPIEEIQIIGVLETRLLDFDNLLILNVEEGVVPGAPKDNSYIPFDIRKGYGMQTHEDESKIYAYNFFRLVRRAKNVTLLFSEAAGDMQKKSMSRFIMQMLLSPDFQVIKKRIVEAAQTDAIQDIQPTMQWTGDYLSPSAISCYIECPRQFYIKYVLGIRQPDEESLLLQPNELGTLVHGTIQRLYEHSPHPLSEPDYADRLKDALTVSYGELNEKRIPQEHEAENEAVRGMVHNILQYDAKTENLQLLYMEEKRYSPLQISDERISIGGIIDRVDSMCEQACEYLRIVDYKTGSYNADKMKVNAIADLFIKPEKRYLLQTLIYCWVVSHHPDMNPRGLPIMPELLFTQKISGDPHLSVADTVIRDFSRFMQDFEQALTEQITKMRNDTAFVLCDPSPCSNSFCPFHLLCGREKNR